MQGRTFTSKVLLIPSVVMMFHGIVIPGMKREELRSILELQALRYFRPTVWT
jgi:hypothetical protein